MTARGWAPLVLVGVLVGAILGPLASVLFRVMHHNMGEWADIDDEADQ